MEFFLLWAFILLLIAKACSIRRSRETYLKNKLQLTIKKEKQLKKPKGLNTYKP